jgi:hypothetical protein
MKSLPISGQALPWWEINPKETIGDMSFFSGNFGRAVLCTAALLFCSCFPDNHGKLNREAAIPDIQTALKQYSDSLMAIPGVVGVWEGRTASDKTCIRVAVDKKTADLAKKIPTVLQGFPVEIEETGPIRPMQ